MSSCAWCRGGLAATVEVRRGRYCSKTCRQAAFRLRKISTETEATSRPLRFCYADPPFPGRARKYYRDEASYRGEVDHAALLAKLQAGYTGWALSTSADALRWLLPLCPEGVRVCPWVKPIGASSRTRGMHNCWEPVIVMPGRRRAPGVRDWVSAQPARGGGDLPGRKPLRFCAQLFAWLGMVPGDELEDLFPGTGIVGQAWAVLSSSAVRDTSSPAPGDIIATARDASRRASSDTRDPFHDRVCGVCGSELAAGLWGSCWCRVMTCSPGCGNVHRATHDDGQR